MLRSSSSLLLILRFLFLFLVWATLPPVQGTFSIVAVDTETKDIGSAGASCVFEENFNVTTIAAVIPGKGAINVQGWLDPLAKTRAAELFRKGNNSTYVMSDLPRETQKLNDNSADVIDAHQYVVVDIHGNTATHSGYAVDQNVEAVEGNASSRFFFSIAGNFLDNTLNVTQRMKNAFENTQDNATLADRLMAALRAGDMVGADRRCGEADRSSTGAYLQMARPTDMEDHLSVNISVPTINSDPIGALSLKYDKFKRTTPSNAFVTQGLTVINIILLLFL